eukprot:TRINITY_DN52527_c0_g1_i1.p1 TRINITY_DN52527_c0_g1~~TRINITY_DN52527_c0_g1_i1.p1  ORF type:complete len:563 (+),score=105.57 TRINITY_DN52527_c0_g1_i1:61-1749(+)
MARAVGEGRPSDDAKSAVEATTVGNSDENVDEDMSVPPRKESSNSAIDEKSSDTIDKDKPLKKLSFIRMNCMLCFFVVNGVLLASYMLLILPLESQRMDNDHRSVMLAIMMLISGVTQVINPLVGLLSDRCMSSWGRRRPFMVLGGCVGILGVAVQDFASMNHWPYLYMVSFTFSMLALNTVFTAVVGIMPDMVPTEQTGVASGISALHTVAGSNLGLVVYDNLSGSTEERLHGMYVFFTTSIALSLAITVLACDEKVLMAPPTDCAGEDENDKESRNSRGLCGEKHRCLSIPIQGRDLIDSYYIDPRQHTDFAIVFWSRTFYYTGVSMQAFFKYYLEDVVGIEDSEAALVKTAVIGQFCAALAALPTGRLSDYFGAERRVFIYLSCVILAAGNLANCFVRSAEDVYVIAGILGAGNGVYLAMDAALALDHLPSGDEAARFMGVWGIGCFLGSAIGPVLGGPVLAAFGRDPERPQAYSYAGYATLLVFASICFGLSGWTLKFVGTQVEIPSFAGLRRCGRRLRSGDAQAASSLTTKAPSSWLDTCNPRKWYSQLKDDNWINV